MESLAEIGKRHGTDKVNRAHSFDNRNYLDIYEGYFRSQRMSAVTLLEIGVKEGKSLRVWEEYFPAAQIVGLDIDPACKAQQTHRSRVYIGSQDDPKIIAQLNQDYPQGFDIVIDDGAHLNQMILGSFKMLWPCVKLHGLYIIEDLRNSYVLDIHADMVRGGWDVKQPEGTELVNDRTVIDNWLLEKIKEMDFFKGDLAALHLWPMVAIALKIGSDK